MALMLTVMLCPVGRGGEGTLPAAGIWPQGALGAGPVESLLEGPTLGPWTGSIAWETHRCNPPTPTRPTWGYRRPPGVPKGLQFENYCVSFSKPDLTCVSIVSWCGGRPKPGQRAEG